MKGYFESMIFFTKFTIFLFSLSQLISTSLAGEDPETMEKYQWLNKATQNETDALLTRKLKGPLCKGLDASAPLKLLLDGRKLFYAGKKEQAQKKWDAGLLLTKQKMGKLPQATWPKIENIELKLLEKYYLAKDVSMQIISFSVDGLKQYGLFIRPETKDKNKKYPLILNLHGAAYGVPVYTLPFLKEVARQGYCIIAPSMRGENLFLGEVRPEKLNELRSEGKIENLKGEVNDALAAVNGAQKLPWVKKGKFGIIGHSFGSGAGLLCAVRTDQVAVVVSYDSWLMNPFRFYYDRLRHAGNNWRSWEYFVERMDTKKQLSELMLRSVTHHADKITAPLLLFLGEDDVSVYHKSHKDFKRALKKYKKTFELKIMKNGGHNFVLYQDQEPAKKAFKIQSQWLKKYLYPKKKN